MDIGLSIYDIKVKCVSSELMYVEKRNGLRIEPW